MWINRKYLRLIIFAVIFSQNEPIKFSLDTFGQSEYYLSELNPFYQSTLRIGTISMSPVSGIPQGASDMVFGFIGFVDSSSVTSQFNYSRGSDSFRETKILASNFIAENKKLLFKAHGRKYPGIGVRTPLDTYESFGEGYILQNYLIDYLSYNDGYSVRVSKYYHKEDTEIPIDNVDKKRLVQVDGLGIDLDIDSHNNFLNIKYKLGVNYYNNFHHVEHIGQDYDNYEYGIESKYALYFNERISSLFNFNYKEAGREDYERLILNYGKFGAQYNSLNNIFKIGFDWIDSNSDIVEKKPSLFFDFNWNLYNRWIFNIKRDRVFSGLNSPFTGASNQYSLSSVKMNLELTPSLLVPFKTAAFSMYYYNIEDIDYNDRIQSSNSLIKISIDLGNQGLTDLSYGKSDLQDMIAMSLNYHNYMDYSPIKFNLDYWFHFKYLGFYDSKKYFPYFNFQLQLIEFYPGYGPSLSSNYINYDENVDSFLRVVTSKLEFGLSFETFIISFYMLNPGRNITYSNSGSIISDEQYYFSDELTDIQNPLYQMNYITLRWQFSD